MPFLGPLLRHTEVPRLGVKSKLQPLAYARATATRDPSRSVTYTTAHGNAGSLTCYAMRELPILLFFLKNPEFQSQVFYFILFFVFLPFLGPLQRHMEVPRLGIELEPQLPGYTTATATQHPSHVCNLHHSSRQRRILNPLSKGRDRTCNLMVPSRIH